MKRLFPIFALTTALFLPPFGQTAVAAVGDSLTIASDTDVTIRLLGVNTSYTDNLTVYSKSGLDLSGSNPQDRWIQAPLFTTSTPVGTEYHLPGQLAGYPLLFFLRNETLAAGDFSEIFRFTTGDQYPLPYFFDLSISHAELADVRYLPDNKVAIGFTDSEPAGTTAADFVPRELADYAMSIEVSGIASIPAPSTWLLSLLALLPAVVLARRRRLPDGGRPA